MRILLLLLIFCALFKFRRLKFIIFYIRGSFFITTKKQNFFNFSFFLSFAYLFRKLRSESFSIFNFENASIYFIRVYNLLIYYYFKKRVIGNELFPYSLVWFSKIQTIIKKVLIKFLFLYFCFFRFSPYIVVIVKERQFNFVFLLLLDRI